MSVALAIIIGLGLAILLYGLFTKNLPLVAFSVSLLLMSEAFRALVGAGL